MGDLGGQPAGRAQPFLAHGEFGGFRFGPLLLFKKHLDAVAAQRPCHQHDHALGRFPRPPILVLRRSINAVQKSACQETQADKKVHQQLRKGHRYGHGVVQNQRQENPDKDRC